jgi:hypothetical protein
MRSAFVCKSNILNMPDSDSRYDNRIALFEPVIGFVLDMKQTPVLEEFGLRQCVHHERWDGHQRDEHEEADEEIAVSPMKGLSVDFLLA